MGVVWWIRGVGMLVAALGLAGCASLPTPQTDRDSLIMIPVQTLNASNQGFARTFYLEFADGRPEAEIPSDGSPFLAVVVRGASLGLKGIRSEIRSDRSYIQGASAQQALDVTLVGSPGRVMVTPWAFLVYQARQSTAETVSGARVFPATEAVRRAAIDAARRMPGWTKWSAEFALTE